MNLVNLKLGEAQYFIKQNHRHSDPLKRHKFSIGVCNDDYNELYGVLTVDVPSGKWKNPQGKIEIRRVCTLPNQKNVASFLIGHACNACFSMGYTTIITYTQPHESGISLLASGFEVTKAAKLSFYADNHFEGGLITWMKHKDYQYCPEARQRSKQWIKERHEFIKKCRNKRWN